jgi:hypothetical protein
MVNRNAKKPYERKKLAGVLDSTHQIGLRFLHRKTGAIHKCCGNKCLEQLHGNTLEEKETFLGQVQRKWNYIYGPSRTQCEQKDLLRSELKYGNNTIGVAADDDVEGGYEWKGSSGTTVSKQEYLWRPDSETNAKGKNYRVRTVSRYMLPSFPHVL